ncbi:hypothetical protein YC2023_019091 [Brassica napus]
MSLFIHPLTGIPKSQLTLSLMRRISMSMPLLASLASLKLDQQPYIGGHGDRK